jgi:hypothetical protein
MKPVLTTLRIWAARILLFVVPQRVKRLIVLGSLAAKMCEHSTGSSVCKSKLQVEMDLCKDPNALDLPFLLKEKIWTKATRDIDELLKETLAGELIDQQDWKMVARRIVSKMPCALYWADKATVTKDVTRLLNRRQHIFA